MNVQFYTGGKLPPRAVGFLPCKQPTVIRLLCKESDWVKVWLHWHNGRSVPCCGQQCRHCAEEPRLYAYGACIAGTWGHRGFANGYPAVCCVSVAAWSLTEGDYRSHAIELRRMGCHANAELTYRILGDCNEPMEVPFPIRQRLMTIWQIRHLHDEGEMLAHLAEIKRLKEDLAGGLHDGRDGA